MKGIREVARMSGVSVRTLQYYDKIGLLSPAARTDAGYRLYDDEELRRLQQILIYRELQFPLKDIKIILDSPRFDVVEALGQQIELLELKRQHLTNLITLAEALKITGVNYMTDAQFEAFDLSRLDESIETVRAYYGNTDAFQEYEARRAETPEEEIQAQGKALEDIMLSFAALRSQGREPDDDAVQALVKTLQTHITNNFYTCDDVMLLRLGRLYAGGGHITQKLEELGGEGTSAFIYNAIRIKVR